MHVLAQVNKSRVQIEIELVNLQTTDEKQAAQSDLLACWHV